MQTKINSKIANNPSFEMVKIKTESNLGVLKTLVLGAIILVQLGLLIFSWIYLIGLFQWLVIFSVVVSITFCIITLSSKRTGQVKATWILIMLLTPTFGWVIFLLSNEKLMFGRAKKRYKKIYERTKFLDGTAISASLATNIKNNCNYLYKSGNFLAYQSSDTKYYSNGASLFDDMLEDMEKAKKFILIEFFIVSDGVLLSRMLDILKTKAKEGVDIRLIYDDMGSHGTLSRRTKKEIKKSGIKLVTYNKLVPLFNLALNIRDHRKIVVIDGEIGYTGGTNLSDEYVGEKRTHGYWKDEGIRITGKSVDTFTLGVLRQWEFLTKKAPNYLDFLSNATKEEKADSKNIIVPYLTGPDYETPIARELYENIIGSAQEKLYIMTPYFIPDESTFALLKSKAQSGVDVRIILPEVPDKAFVYLISLDGAEKLMGFGAKVYVMKNAFVHSKLMLTESDCVVGSINLDQRSYYQQFESAVYTNDKSVLESVGADFEKTMLRSNLHKKKKMGLIKWTLIHILRLVSPLM